MRKPKKEVDFEEVLLDAVNVSALNQNRLEGSMEIPIRPRNVRVVVVLFIAIAAWFLWQLFTLQILAGAAHRATSENNHVQEDVIVAERGVVRDRYNELLIWNEEDYDDEYEFPIRAYTNRHGLGQVLGYVNYPRKDRQGFYFRVDYIGRTGIERAFNNVLAGQNGRQLIEVDALGERIAEYAVESPTAGHELTLSLDAALSEAIYQIIATSTAQSNARSGAGAVMDVTTGELLAAVSFPAYDPEVMADGTDHERIAQYNADPRFPFLNKVVAGVYTPGSIVKPFVAYAALAENIIDPDTNFTSAGTLVVPNRFNPSQPTVFRDWREHGLVDMRRALAVSSNVYFYTVSGGFEDQVGLGIDTMADYFARFGFGKKTGIALANEQAGTVPTPDWKRRVFADDWRVGDTYLTAIGQYGWQTTPLQMLTAYGALANGGKLFTPHLSLGEIGQYADLSLDQANLAVVKEGMRLAVTADGGTARSLERSDVAIAAKSGTAELDSTKTYLNTWAVGFWPYQKPRYAFILLIERTPYENRLGGTVVMGQVFDWLAEHRPEYLTVVE